MTAPEKMSDEVVHACFQQRIRDKQAERRMIAEAICTARDMQWLDSIPEGCTPSSDAAVLREANHALAAEVDRLQSMLSNADCEWQAKLDAAVDNERESCAAACHAAVYGRLGSYTLRQVADLCVDAIRARGAA